MELDVSVGIVGEQHVAIGIDAVLQQTVSDDIVDAVQFGETADVVDESHP